MRSTFLPGAVAAIVAGALAPNSAGAGEAAVVAAVQFPTVEVIGTTPLPGLGLPLSQVPGNVQHFDAQELTRRRQGIIAEFLNESAASVNTSAASGNPSQLDFAYRGFTASPLLGTPQGLSVFLDGVRINETFGDVVNWDLLPLQAVADVVLVPGSNPVYGLNTLGGALALTTKNGADYPGGSATVEGGSFARRAFAAEYGAARDELDWFVAGNAADERGYREHSTSRLRQAFGKIRYRARATLVEASVNLAQTRLEGTQALPESMLQEPRQAYTWPDITRNRLGSGTLRVRHDLGSAGEIVGQAYGRRLHNRSFNSNINDVAEDDAPPATNVDSLTESRGWGASLQWTGSLHSGFALHRTSAGVSADLGTTDFTQTNQAAAITDGRETVGLGPPAAGAAAHTDVRQLGVYALDSIALTERLSVLVAARYQTARLSVEDRSGDAPGLNGTHRFSRVNPAAGLTYALDGRHSVYANWSQGMRVPTAMELTCADPDAPCSLPNIFVSDPPLKAVLATTVEAGARGAWRTREDKRVAWNAAVYRTTLRDDIQFITAGGGATNAGYFANVGNTSRTGLELGASVPLGAWRVVARYSYTRALFDSEFVEHSPSNASANAAGDIVVHPGDRLPGIPAHLGKLRVEWSPRAGVDVAATLLAASRQFLRGNENNADPKGVGAGYALVALDGSWQFAPRWELTLSVSNLFDRRYTTFGILAENFFRGPNGTYAPDLRQPEAFFGPGTPRAAWVSLRYSFDPRT